MSVGTLSPDPQGLRGARRHSPLELMVPSSYFLTSTKSTKSLGEISLMAAEGVAVLVMHRACQGRGVVHIHGVIISRSYSHIPIQIFKNMESQWLQEIYD